MERGPVRRAAVSCLEQGRDHGARLQDAAGDDGEAYLHTFHGDAVGRIGGFEMSPTQDLPDACVACGAPSPAEVEAAGVDELAGHWSADPTMDVTAAGAAALLRDCLGGASRVRIARCGRCGLEMAVPGLTWTGDTYPRQEYYLAFDHQRALDRLSRLPPTRILELGCGDGQFLAAARELGHEGLGLDFVESAVQAASARGVTAVAGDLDALEHWGEGGGPYGVVAMFQILEHVADPLPLLRRLRELTRPGGQLFVGVPAPDRFSRGVPHPDRVGSTDFWDWPPQHALRWTEDALRDALSATGWTVRACTPEPLRLVGAAAYVAAVRGRGKGWYGNPVLRRVGTARALAQIALLHLRRTVTGIRLFVAADRGD
jgi:SAM-dependent methyltransferase